MPSSACLSHHLEAEHLKDSNHYLPSNLLANLLIKRVKTQNFVENTVISIFSKLRATKDTTFVIV